MIFFFFHILGSRRDFMETYIVEVGDNLKSIADKLGVKVVDLVKENQLESIADIEPGMELIIPQASHNDFDYKD